jgi:hypothetical protein
MSRFADTRLFDSGLVIWVEMPRWCGWLFANACGACATVDDRFDVVATLLTTAGPVVSSEGVPLGLLWPGDGGAAVGTGMMAEVEPNGPRYYVPYHEYALRFLSAMQWLVQRYPEFAGSRGRLADAFDQFSFLSSLAAAKAGQRVVGTWTMRTDGAVELSRRIRRSEALRREVAAAVGATEEELASQGDELLRTGAIAPGAWFSDATLNPDRR